MYGSLTKGVMISTVSTIAVSLNKKTPASSPGPTRISALLGLCCWDSSLKIKPESICSRSDGPVLPAQPAALTFSVSLYLEFFID